MSHEPETTTEQIAPLPRISMQAFCETPEVAQVIQEAIADRRMERAHVKVHMGGATAAIEAYRSAATPNVIFLETTAAREELFGYLHALAEFCDPGTRVVVAGRMNDIVLYRELMAHGISEYLVAPFSVLDFIRTISHLYTNAGAEPVGKIIAFTGAKGGVGASTLAHNVAWAIPRQLDVQSVLVDLDLGFGTAGLDFNQDPPQGIAEAVFAPDRVDSNLVDRLLSRCADKMSLLAAPATLDRVYDFTETAFDAILDILRASTPCVVLDVPHMWTAWARRMLIGADEIVVVAVPDLANLRNAKSIVDTVRAARPNDAKPKLVFNLVGIPKRPEISTADFARAVDLEPAAIINFDPKLFGTAANNGQMIGEVEPASKAHEAILEIARLVTGRFEVRKSKKTLFDPLKLLGLSKAS
ncbi:MAG TPA: AAA family ATPase [Methylovirgula sp.]|nr:AAA family ATPase [Methylovirgula sp.]